MSDATRSAAWCPDCRQCPAAENSGIGCKCPCHASAAANVTGEEDVEMAPLLDGAIEPNAERPKGSSSAATSAAISYDDLLNAERDALAQSEELIRQRNLLRDAASLPDGVGHWLNGGVHWFDPSSSPDPKCPLCAAILEVRDV